MEIARYVWLKTWCERSFLEGLGVMVCSCCHGRLGARLGTLQARPQQTSRFLQLTHLVGALYNDVFHQIISGDNMGTVSVWDIQTGKLEFEFRRAHQDNKMIKALPLHRR